LLTLKKGQKIAQCPNHFISGKQFQKGQMATLPGNESVIQSRFSETDKLLKSHLRSYFGLWKKLTIVYGALN